MRVFMTQEVREQVRFADCVRRLSMLASEV